MVSLRASSLSRRSFLIGGAAAGAAAVVAGPHRGLGAATAPAVERRLVAASARVSLIGDPYPETAVWSYGGQVPGPEIRLRQGERLRVSVDNHLKEGTTVHWHGLRVPNAMDGAPDVAQAPIAPGGTFIYEFNVPDAGTYWYHPHQRSFEQVGRGLYGPLIVEEHDPLPVDRDVVWVLGDWRLDRQGAIVNDFGNRMEMSMSGRVGNTVTVNGHVPDRFDVRAGERIRLRLINAATARIFGLGFRGHSPLVIAFDGQPVEPHEPEHGRVVLGPAMRTDLLLDMGGRPGRTFQVVDTFYRDLAYSLIDIAYGPEAPIRESAPARPPRLPANTMPEPDLTTAKRHVVEFNGGMMSGMGGMSGGGMMGNMMRGGGMMGGMMHGGGMWSINGIAAAGHVMEPLLTLTRGRSYVLELRNETAWWHPIHLHGHSFRVIARNGAPTRFREWRDTVLIPPRERADIAFVADNPGDWMFHCHVLEHQEGGMMGVIRVT